jgi:hypothetical protein
MNVAPMNTLSSFGFSWYSNDLTATMPPAFPEHLARLLTSSIETEERLDVLCLLKRSRPRTFTAKSVASELSIPTSKAENALAMLCGRGFLTVNIANDLFYSYAPVSPTIDKALDELTQLYTSDRPRVIEVLSKQHGRDPAHAFANAFLVRKKDGDG